MGTTSTIVTIPSDVEVVTSRTFDAPRGLVFEAFTRPEHISRWCLGPDGWSMPVCEIDLQVGGRWRWVWRADDGSHQFEMSGVYQEITPPERIVNTEVFEGTEAVITAEFTEENGRTTVTQTMRFPSKEARDAAMATGMTDGVDISYHRLADLLTTL